MTKANLGERFRNPKKILAFDARLKLTAIFQSITQAQHITGISHQQLLKCCDGNIITCKSMYFRHASLDIIVDIDDIGKLSLLEYDRTIGVNRSIYATKKMKRDEIILESQYKQRFQYLQSKRSKLWKISKLR